MSENPRSKMEDDSYSSGRNSDSGNYSYSSDKTKSCCIIQ